MGAKCGTCRWFDGDGWLDERGRGMGQCCYGPPVWCGPSAALDDDAWLEMMEDRWSRPMVGVAQKACSRHEARGVPGWWEAM